MALVSEWLQSTVVGVGDDDSTLIGNAHSLRIRQTTTSLAEVEQERAIDRRQYLHSMILGIAHNDSVSVMIDRNA